MMNRVLVLSFVVFSVSAGELWLPEIRERTQIRIVNPIDEKTTVRFRAYGENGALLAQEDVALDEYEGRYATMAELFGISGSVSSLRANAPGGIWLDAVITEGDADMHVQAQTSRRGPFLLAHVAEATEQWDTSICLATNGGTSPVNLSFPMGQETWHLQHPHQAIRVNMENTFGVPISQGSGWGVIDSLETQMAGWINFITHDLRQAAVVPLSLERSNFLILPHIPVDKNTWWSGLAVVNTNGRNLELDVRVYSNEQLVQQEAWSIPSFTKKVGLLESFFAAGLHEDASWIEFKGNVAFSGFELFGTHNGETLAGLPLGTQYMKTAMFGRVGRGDDWSGIVLLNPGDRAISVVVEMFSDEGVERGSRLVELGPREKTAFIPETWFSVGSTDHWVRLSSSYGFISFSLYGDKNQTRLISSIPLQMRNSGSNLGVPMICVDTTENLFGKPAAHGDFDGDGIDELVTTTETDLVFLDISDDLPSQNEVPFSSLEYTNPKKLEIGLFVSDLDQDEQMELLLTTDKLSMFTVNDSFEPSWFQEYEPPIEIDQTIRECVDINRDNYLDILCDRSLFMSILGVDDFYWRNTFPYMFQTTGRGSVFLPLDEETRWDILTVLFDDFYAVLTGNLDPDPEPIYTPKFGWDILEIHKYDFGLDGQHEVMSFLSDTSNSVHARFADVSRFSATGADTINQFEVPPEWGLGRLTPVERQSGQRLVFKQEIGSISRFWWADPTGVEPKHAQAGRGTIFDLNGDGLDDFVSPSGCILGQPSGILQNPALPIINAYATGSEVRTFIDDYDSDQQNEVLTLSKAPGGSYIQVTLWEFLEDGSVVTAAYDFGVEASFIGFAEMTDADGDKDLDFILAGAGLFVFENNNGSFSPSPNVVHTPAVFSLTGGKKADFNNNGIVDLLAKTPLGGGSLEIILDIYSEQPRVIHLNLHSELEFTEITDVNDDGFVDILSFDPLRSAMVIYNQNGDSYSKMEIGMNVVHFAMNDFTGEGDLDIVGFVISADQDHTYFRLARNRGDGNFSGMMVIELPDDAYYTRLLSVDLNSDGRQDLIGFGSSETSDIQYLDFWENRYTKELLELPFRRISRVSMGQSATAELRDFDADGLPDLQIYEPHQFLWFRNRTSYYPHFGIQTFFWP